MKTISYDVRGQTLQEPRNRALLDLLTNRTTSRVAVVLAITRGRGSVKIHFRVPKASPEKEVQFYQRDYEQGFTTDCPTPDELTRLKRCCFAGTEKDYSSYVAVLRAMRLAPGSSIFDFGCSWGYGSWQLRHAGYRVYSFEVSRPRARYAVENLQCELFPPDKLPEKVDCFFAAHVIEHLTNPRVIWGEST